MYASIAPILLPVAFLLFSWASLIYKNQALYVYVQKADSGGAVSAVRYCFKKIVRLYGFYRDREGDQRNHEKKEKQERTVPLNRGNRYVGRRVLVVAMGCDMMITDCCLLVENQAQDTIYRLCTVKRLEYLSQGYPS